MTIPEVNSVFNPYVDSNPQLGQAADSHVTGPTCEATQKHASAQAVASRTLERQSVASTNPISRVFARTRARERDMLHALKIRAAWVAHATSRPHKRVFPKRQASLETPCSGGDDYSEGTYCVSGKCRKPCPQNDEWRGSRGRLCLCRRQMSRSQGENRV
jgi:hypothetical protein